MDCLFALLAPSTLGETQQVCRPSFAPLHQSMLFSSFSVCSRVNELWTSVCLFFMFEAFVTHPQRLETLSYVHPKKIIQK